MSYFLTLNPYNLASSGIGFCVGLSAIGAGWGIWTCGTASCGTAGISGKIAMRDIMNLILCEVIAIYGLIMAIVLEGRCPTPPSGSSQLDYRKLHHAGFSVFFSGLVQGCCSFSAGLAIGVVGATISIVCHRDADLFFKLLIVQIFSELIGIMGLLVCLLTSMKSDFQGAYGSVKL